MTQHSEAWFVSAHGGHSGPFCDHAKDTLRDILEAAVARGFRTYGVTEHAPRVEDRFLYQEERAMGWDIPKIMQDFEAYGRSIAELAEEYADRLIVLRGFEAEVVPADRYAHIMLEYRRRFAFEYMVGSVHWVDEVLIDGPREEFYRAAEVKGGIEALAVRYYQTVAEMVESLRPEVVGHLDVIRKHAPSEKSVATPAVRRAADETLAVIRKHWCILDLNTAGLRKGLGRPYPAPWLVALANERGIPFCFGDDSHSAGDVGAGIEEAREYLLELGVDSIAVPTRQSGGLAWSQVPLDTGHTY